MGNKKVIRWIVNKLTKYLLFVIKVDIALQLIEFKNLIIEYRQFIKKELILSAFLLIVIAFILDLYLCEEMTLKKKLQFKEIIIYIIGFLIAVLWIII